MSTKLEWSTRIYCNASQISGPFSVYIFLGNVPADPRQWPNDPAFVGVYDVYSDGGENQGNPIVRGFVHLNRAILERSGRNSLEANVVVPYLKQRLNWAVLRVLDGTTVDAGHFTSLEVTVLCTPLTLPVGGTYPIEGKPVYYHDITRGRPGGYRGIYDS